MFLLFEEINDSQKVIRHFWLHINTGTYAHVRVSSLTPLHSLDTCRSLIMLRSNIHMANPFILRQSKEITLAINFYIDEKRCGCVDGIAHQMSHSMHRTTLTNYKCCVANERRERGKKCSTTWIISHSVKQVSTWCHFRCDYRNINHM